MSRMIHRLKPVSLSRLARKAGMHCDGGGLYLCVQAPCASSWTFRFMLAGKAREMGLGSYPLVSLAEARMLAADARKLKSSGKDPVDAKHAGSTVRAGTMTFKQCAESYIVSHRDEWKSAIHAAQWTATLATHVEPVIGTMPVQAVDTGHVMKVLTPIWQSTHETAWRLRGRIESVLDWATVKGYRQGENPARWKGHLEHLLARRKQIRKIVHLAALPYAEIGDFMKGLRARESNAARGLEFMILTAARTGEVRGAVWTEINLKDQMWAIPGSRMKRDRDHRVLLSDAALAVLNKVPRQREHVFHRAGGHILPVNAMLDTLQSLRADLTAHGFRASFKTWATECTDFPREVIELALAHAVGDAVEAAYQRGEMLEKRRALMQEWADFCAMAPAEHGNVVTVRSKREPVPAVG
jgi:integrase